MTSTSHILLSNESDSSSDERVDGEISDAFGWKKVDQEQERYRSRTTDPTFIPRHSMCPHNTYLDSDNEPVDFFSLFFDDEIWDILLRETNRYARQFLDQEAAVKWLEKHL